MEDLKVSGFRLNDAGDESRDAIVNLKMRRSSLKIITNVRSFDLKS